MTTIEPLFVQLTPSLRVTTKAIKMKADIEKNLKQTIPEVDKNFMHRVIAFSLSGTEVVDLRHFENKKAKVACGLSPGYLTNFLCQLIFSRRKVKRISVKDM